MASTLKIGQHLKGSLDTYSVTKKLFDSIWRATGSLNSKDFIVKTAPYNRLQTERDLLRRFQGHSSIRQLVDEVAQPPALVLEHLDDNVLAVSDSSKLTRPEIKFIVRHILEALQAIHETGHVHTDIKPDNILVRFGTGPMRFTEAKLADCGDACYVPPDADPKEDGHIIGAAIFRSPEALLNLRWGTPTDIWSFGATLTSLIWGGGWHIFKPNGVSPDGQAYALHVLIQQVRFFGPFPLSYQEIADDERLQICTIVLDHIADNNLGKPFSLVVDEELTAEDREFVCKIMKLDPRDRPTAKELLEDKWLES